MNVLLISCYELGHQPLGLASPAAHFRAADVPVRCLDLSVESIDEDAIRAAEFVGISVPMHTATRIGLRVGRRVRELNPDAHICFYGLYASLNEEYLLEACADTVVGGEYETPLVDLVMDLAGRGGGEPEGIRTADDETPPFLGRQQFLPPARDLLPPLERYAHLQTPDGEFKPVGYLEASRGCAHQCRHCPIPPVYSGRLRIVQQEVALEDIRTLAGMGARHITFGDPDFLNGVRHSMRIVRQMHEEFPELSFDVTAKVEHLIEHRDLIPELGRLGCAFILSAVESLNDDILEYLDKGHTDADVQQALEITRDAGVPLRPTFVAFTPWTTIGDFLDILEFVERNGLIHHVDPVQYSIRLLLPPNSRLLEIPETRPHLDGLDRARFVHRWTHPDPRVDALQEKVAAVVEEAASTEEDAATTFYKVKGLALGALAGREATAAGTAAAAAPPAPRLTEAWFC